MISILVLMPWHETNHITIRTRHLIYETVVQLLGLLNRTLSEQHQEMRLNTQLRDRLVNCSLLCPGFTVFMKQSVAFMAGKNEGELCGKYNLPRYGQHWRHQYGLTVKPGAPLDVIEVSSL